MDFINFPNKGKKRKGPTTLKKQQETKKPSKLQAQKQGYKKEHITRKGRLC